MKKFFVTSMVCISVVINTYATTYVFTVDDINYSAITDDGIAFVEGTTKKREETFNLTIPETIVHRGISYPVIGVNSEAFENYCGLTTVNLPNGLTKIDSKAFYNCTSLTSVNFPNGLTTIGDEAFYNCKSLTSITFPNSLTTIGASAFYQCTSLTGELIIPDGVTSIGTIGYVITPKRAFEGCNGITSLITPGKVAGIGFAADNNITSVVVTKGDMCGGFGEWENLTSVKLLDGVTSIGEYTFEGCRNLTSIDIPDGIPSIEYRTFKGCSGLTSITLPNSVTYIENYAFDGCSSLTSITIPDSVGYIGEVAFLGCSGVTSLTTPGQVAGLGFDKNCNITSVKITTGDIRERAFTEWEHLMSVELLDGVTSIGQWAFYSCSNLTGDLIIPDKVTSIGASAFYECSKLTGSLIIPDKVTTIGSMAFDGCSGFTGTLTLSKNLTTIGHRAFQGCTFTGDLIIPDNVTQISYKAFEQCWRFTSLTIGRNVKTIREDAFSNCFGFSGTLTIPDSVKVIEKHAFYNCDFTMIIIGKGVTSIGEETFCCGIYIINAVTPPSIGENAIYLTYPSVIYVPCGTQEIYEREWSDYVDYIHSVQHTLSISYIGGTNSFVSFVQYPTCENNVAIIRTNYRNYPNTDEFVQWSDGNTDDPRTIVVDKDMSLIAEFREKNTTPVDDVSIDESPSITRKILRDGQLIIRYDGKEYNVLGECITNK